MKFKLKAILRNYAEPVEITSIDFKRGTFTWDRWNSENVEDMNDAEIFVEDIETTAPAQAG